MKNSSAFPTSNSPLSLALSATSPPKSLKIQAMETPWISGGRVSSLSGELQVHFSLCTAIVPLCGCPPPVSVTTPQPSLSKSAIPKSSLPYWSSVSDRDQAESFIRRLAALGPLHRRASWALRDPWSTPTDAPSHIDLSPTLRQNWSLRAKRTVP